MFFQIGPGVERLADRAVATMSFRTVSRSLAGKVMLFHHALKTFALRAPDDVNEVAG
jgi:hypothetical protein